MIRLTVCLLALVVGSAQADPIQSYDTYRSWLLACDNTLNCVAKGFGDIDPRAEVTLERAAGSDGELLLRLASGTAFTIDQVAIDGNPVILESSEWAPVPGDVGTTFSSDQLPVVHSLLAQIKDGHELSFGPGGEIPLDGLVAALLRMDERQGRLGGTTALIRKGRLPASRVPDAPPVPTIPDRPITASLNPGEAEHLAATVRSTQTAVFAEEGCQDDRLAIEPSVYALSDAQALVTFACIMGAYQGSSIGFLISRDNKVAQQLKFPVSYQSNGTQPVNEDLLSESDFNPETGRLFMSARGRGLFDCGMSATWLWNGREFIMTELALQERCGGTELADWPTVFRSNP
ncbi:DUF1176 domain-containing protein [Aureimonas sp. Leaf454]|uniref:DUF1176 domain-containing protein n=1 Tax=Aureimonas sp. Leaf454 TaxID=1736381 RepID=UPI000AD788DC|nr:DUF1176 domain-containing protein [Aureimonas sp. Leaf454]